MPRRYLNHLSCKWMAIDRAATQGASLFHSFPIWAPFKVRLSQCRPFHREKPPLHPATYVRQHPPARFNPNEYLQLPRLTRWLAARQTQAGVSLFRRRLTLPA